jgi:hypothetical protein
MKKEDDLALWEGMSQETRRAAIGEALTLVEREWPSRSYCEKVWQEMLPQLKQKQSEAT